MHCNIIANFIICISHQQKCHQLPALLFPRSSRRESWGAFVIPMFSGRTVLNFHRYFDRPALILGTFRESEKSNQKLRLKYNLSKFDYNCPPVISARFLLCGVFWFHFGRFCICSWHEWLWLIKTYGEYKEYNMNFSTTFAEYQVTERLVYKLSNIGTMYRRLVNILTKRIRFNWFNQFLIHQYQSVFWFSQILTRIRTRISIGNWILKSCSVYIRIYTHEIEFCSANSFQQFFFLYQNQDSSYKYQRYPRNLVAFHKVFSKSKSYSGSGSGSWFYFGF